MYLNKKIRYKEFFLPKYLVIIKKVRTFALAFGKELFSYAEVVSI